MTEIESLHARIAELEAAREPIYDALRARIAELEADHNRLTQIHLDAMQRMAARIAELEGAIKNCSGSCHAGLTQHNGDKT